MIVNAARFVTITTLSNDCRGRGRACGQVGSGVFVNSSIVLICAVLASLAVGVLLAYGVCLAMFNVFRIHARQIAVKSEGGVVASVRVVQG